MAGDQILVGHVSSVASRPPEIDVEQQPDAQEHSADSDKALLLPHKVMGKEASLMGKEHSLRPVLSHDPNHLSPRGSHTPNALSPNSYVGSTPHEFGLGIGMHGWSPDSKSDDPYNLRRFTKKQKTHFQQALHEVQVGRKKGHWIWYMIPTPPFLREGVELGSPRNQSFSLRSDGEVVAYLQFESHGVNLRNNYFEIMSAVRDQLRKGRSARSIFGEGDTSKVVNSATLFERVTREGVDDPELNMILAEILQQIEESPKSSGSCVCSIS